MALDVTDEKPVRATRSIVFASQARGPNGDRAGGPKEESLTV